MKQSRPHARLGDLCEVTYGTSAPTSSEGAVPVIGMQHVRDGRLELVNVPRATLDAAEVNKLALRAGDILFNRTNSIDHVGKSAMFEGNGAHPIVFASYLVRLRPNTDRVVPAYLATVLMAPSTMRRIKAMATQGVQQCNINPSRLAAHLSIPLLELRQQQVVAAVAARCDVVVDELRAAADAKRRLKRALLQQLLAGTRRLRGAAASRRRVALADLADELSDRNGTRLGAERVMGVLKYEGLVPMRERTMADDLSRYKVVPPRAFAYNPMRINIGSIAYSAHAGDVLVSPDYEVFATRADRLDPRYLDHVRRTEAWSSFVKRAGNGSVRVRIYFQDLAQFVFPLPPLAEQQRIAGVLDTLDHEIALLDRQLAAHRQLKRGLMQQLLTGEIGGA